MLRTPYLFVISRKFGVEEVKKRRQNTDRGQVRAALGAAREDLRVI